MAKVNGSYASIADRSIGALLVDHGRLTAEDAERIMKLQREEDIRFGEAGIKLGLLTEADILFALSLQFDYPYLTGPARPVSEEIVVAYRPFSGDGERLRALRSQLQMRWFDESGKSTAIAIVSPSRGEGRSHLAANLAVAFAQAGDRTLLIDGDLRHSRQHKLFKIDNQVGLSSLLVGRMQPDVIKFVPGIPGLAVLPAGPMPPNPQELLSRAAFDRILEQSMATFNVIVVDTPAYESGPDCTMLARFAGAALAVARTNVTRNSEFNELVEAVGDSGAQVVGSVLVDAPVARKGRVADE